MDPTDDRRHLLVVHHSRTGSTAALLGHVVAGASEGGASGDGEGRGGEGRGGEGRGGDGRGGEVVLRVLHCFEAQPDDVLWADAVIMATPANFGYMSGALKDFLERIYHPCMDRTAGLPYGLVVKGDTDTSGAVSSVTRIVAGLRWRLVGAPVEITGPITPDALAAASDLGATVAAALAAGIY